MTLFSSSWGRYPRWLLTREFSKRAHSTVKLYSGQLLLSETYKHSFWKPLSHAESKNQSRNGSGRRFLFCSCSFLKVSGHWEVLKRAWLVLTAYRHLWRRSPWRSSVGASLRPGLYRELLVVFVGSQVSRELRVGLLLMVLPVYSTTINNYYSLFLLAITGLL